MCQWTMGFMERGNPRIPVMVIRERRHKMTWAMLVPRKGTEFPWIAKRAAKFIDQLGHNRVTHRCDNEPAIEALARGTAHAQGNVYVLDLFVRVPSSVQRQSSTNPRKLTQSIKLQLEGNEGNM